MKNTSHPVDVRRSKPPLLKFPNANIKTSCEFKFLAIKRNQLFGVVSQQGYFYRTPNEEKLNDSEVW